MLLCYDYGNCRIFYITVATAVAVKTILLEWCVHMKWCFSAEGPRTIVPLLKSPGKDILQETNQERKSSGWNKKKKKGMKEENCNDAYYNLISFSPGTDLLKWGQGSTPALPEFCDVEILMLHLAFWPLVWGLGWKAAKKHFGRPLCRTVADEV